MKSLKSSKIVFNTLSYFYLIIFSLAILLPILWVFRTSFVNEVDAYSIPPRIFPSFTLENYRQLLFEDGFMVFLKNSLVVAVVTTAFCTPIACLGGFAFARFETGGNPLKFSILATQMLPGVVLILPLFIVMSKINIVDTYLGLILCYSGFNLPFLIWIMIGFFEGIPKDLDDAAAVDGLSAFKTLFKIIIPISLPGIMAIAILSFIFCWNEFLFAIVISGRETMTIPVRLAAMKTRQGILIAKLSAGTMISILPMILLASFVKKYLISGLSMGAVKN